MNSGRSGTEIQFSWERFAIATVTHLFQEHFLLASHQHDYMETYSTTTALNLINSKMGNDLN